MIPLYWIYSRLEKESVDGFELCNGLVYRKYNGDRLEFYVSAEMEQNVFRRIHEKNGHLGVDKCYDQLRVHYWFPAMHNKIMNFITNCVRCIMQQILTRVEYALNNSVHCSTKKPPSVLLFSVQQRGKEIDELSEFLK